MLGKCILVIAKADVCNKEGDTEYRKEDYYNAIDSYTKGIKASCKDNSLNAILLTSRASAHFHLGETFLCILFGILHAVLVYYPGGLLPSNRLMGMCRWIGSHFHDWTDYNGVAFSTELLEWGHIFSGFGG